MHVTVRILESEVITLLFVDEKFHNQFVNGWKLVKYIFLDEVWKKKKQMLRICIGWEENELEVQEPLN